MRELLSREPDYEAVRRDQATRLALKLGNEAARAMPQMELPMRGLVERLIDVQLRDRHVLMLSRLDAIAREGGDVARAADLLLKNPQLYVAITMGVRRVEAMERAFTICLLAKHLRVAVFGRHDLASWPCHATDLGERPYEHMSAAYARGRVGLNVMRWQDDAGVNLKPLEIAASGVACTQARRTDADRVFSSEESVTFDGPSKALACIQALISDEPSRLKIVANAFRRVRNDHTWHHRARTLADGEGRVIDFKNTIVLLTSNLATDIITQMCSSPVKPTREELVAAIRPTLSEFFKPALLARMEIVPFLTLAPEFLSDIVRLKLRKIEGRLRDSHKMALVLDEKMIDVITRRCTEVETGARNIDHIINQNLLPMLSSALLERMTQGPLPGAVRMTVAEDESFQVEFVEAAN